MYNLNDNKGKKRWSDEIECSTNRLRTFAPVFAASSATFFKKQKSSEARLDARVAIVRDCGNFNCVHRCWREVYGNGGVKRFTWE